MQSNEAFKGNSVSDKKVTWSMDITDEELAIMYSNWTTYVRKKF